VSHILLFGSAQSGNPFIYGFVNNTSQNGGQQVALAYIPYKGEAVNFLQTYQDATTGNTVLFHFLNIHRVSMQ
jgi:hypothetical protein